MKGALGVRKGAWTEEEDVLLKNRVEKHGEGKWHQVPHRAELNRCRKSCRLRCLNYLKPNIKRGAFQEGEVGMIIRLHKLLGNRWSPIAGRLPGRTAKDVKNYWNTHLVKKIIYHKQKEDNQPGKFATKVNVIRPQPSILSKSSAWFGGKAMPVALRTPPGENPGQPSPMLSRQDKESRGGKICSLTTALTKDSSPQGAARKDSWTQARDLGKSLWKRDKMVGTSSLSTPTFGNFLPRTSSHYLAMALLDCLSSYSYWAIVESFMCYVIL